MNDPKPLKLMHVLSGHSGYIFRLKWSPCGRFIASPSQDNTVFVWGVEGGRPVQQLKGHLSEVNSVSWSPNGKKLATVSDDKTTCLWDVQTGKRLVQFTDHHDEINDVDWSPSGDQFATVSDDKRLIVYDVSKQKMIKEYSLHSHAIWSVSWSPDGKWVATCSDDETIRLTNIISGERRLLRGHTSTVRSVTWFPDSKRIASGSRDSTIRLWNIDFPEEHKTFSGHSSLISSISVSYDGRILASKSNDDTVRLWCTSSGDCIFVLHEKACDRWSPGLSFHPKQNILATLGEKNTTIRVWKVGEERVEEDVAHVDPANKNRIFVCYARKDKDWVSRIETTLMPVLCKTSCSFWSDEKIEVGSDWRAEVLRTLEASNVAILLVSPEFLASKFVSEVQLPRVIQRTENKSIKLIWIPLRDSLYEEVELRKFHAAIDPTLPLENMSDSEQNSALVKVSRLIMQYLRTSTPI